MLTTIYQSDLMVLGGGLGYSYPPKELGEGEIMLTYKEYQVLKKLKSLEQGYTILDAVKEKINEQIK